MENWFYPAGRLIAFMYTLHSKVNNFRFGSIQKRIEIVDLITIFEKPIRKFTN